MNKNEMDRSDLTDQSLGNQAQLQLKVPPPDIVQLGTLQLREEMLTVVKEQVQSGQVSFRREVKNRTETVTTELRRETLVITVGAGSAGIFLGEEQLQPGETREVLLYDEQAVVHKVALVTEEIHIGKKSVTETQEQQIDLQYEVLVVDEQPADVASPTPIPETQS